MSFLEKLCWTFIILFVFTSPSYTQVKKSCVVYTITEKDLIPEGITFSPSSNCFYISSIYKGKIVCVDAETGMVKDFMQSDSLNMSFLGMITDEQKKILWVCGNMEKDERNVSCITRISLTTGDILKTYSTNSTFHCMYNDLVQDDNGNIYFTDSRNHAVYLITAKSDTIALFYNGEEIAHPNGITISPDNKYLYIASTDNGIRTLDIQNRKIVGDICTSINSTGIDGLKFYNKSLIGIQNAVKKRKEINISIFYLDKSGTTLVRKSQIDLNNPMFDIPTTFVVVGNSLFCIANSQLKNFDSSSFRIINQDLLKDIIMLKYEL